MPVVNSKKKPAADKPQPLADVKVSEAVEVAYPVLMVNGVEIPLPATIITAAKAKDLLYWEDDDAYAVREGVPVGSVKLGDPLLTDMNGKAVKCWMNSKNRPFTEGWAKQLAQDLLNGNWHFNLENIIISRTGQVTSGQHRLVALVLAAQMWHANPGAYPAWPEEPTIQALIAFGGSDEQAVLNTIDNTRPQDPSDAFYRSGIFDGKNSVDRAELSRMLKRATAMLWHRTGYGNNRYQTVSESVLFEGRHPKLVDAVNHIFVENASANGRPLAKMKLEIGQCSAMMYLMAACESDGETYRKATPPSEEEVKLDRWAKARDFFTDLAKGKFPAVKETLAKIADPLKGTTNKVVEKIAVIAKAWELYLKGKKASKDDLDMKEFYLEGGKLSDMAPNFGGIDMGHDPDFDEDEQETPDEKKRRIAEERKKRAAELNASTRAAKEAEAAVPEKTVAELVEEQMAELNKKFPGRFIVLRHKTAGHVLYNASAEKAAKLLKMTTVNGDGISKLLIPNDKFDEAAKKLLAAKLKVAVVERIKTNEKGVEEDRCRDLFTPPAAAKPTPSAKGKPVARK